MISSPKNNVPQTAFVTGAGGFIGSHLVEALLRKGWRVNALVHYNSRSNTGWLEDRRITGEDSLEIIFGDVRDPHQMNDCIRQCDVVFHLAALIGIPYSYCAPESYVATNVTGTLNVARAALQNGITRLVHTSTSEVYGTAKYTPLDEDHPLQAQSPYSASKIGADKIIESFVCSFGLPAVVVRPFNTYGPRQSARAVIPSIIIQALKGGDVYLGSLDPERDLTFVGDTVEGFISAASAEIEAGSVLNLGSGMKVSIGELARIIFEVMGCSPKIVTDPRRVRPPESEVMELISDNARALEFLGWKPSVSLRKGLALTAEWIREHLEIYRAEEYAI